ncbi:19847_t:CDS:1, partial [Racocetra fulgida]
GKSWVLVAPPKYAPGIPNVVPLYQVILETQHPVDPQYPANDPVNYLNSDSKEKRKEK